MKKKPSAPTKTPLTKRTLKEVFPFLLLAIGVVGLFASFVLTYETVELYKHPTQQLACDLNPIISCGSVMKTWQSEVFGFPNPILGLISFSFFSFTGLALLAGATLKKWFWQLFELGVVGSLLFTFWFQYQSLTNINALCPYCMVVWAITVPLFIYSTIYTVRNKYVVLPAALQKVVTFIGKYHVEVLVGWYMAIILMILNHFWYYWQTLI